MRVKILQQGHQRAAAHILIRMKTSDPNNTNPLLGQLHQRLAIVGLHVAADRQHHFSAINQKGPARLPATLPLYCVGHSAGGQQFGFADNSHEVQGLIAVAASAGYFPHMPLPYRLKAWFFFRIFAPLSSQLLGYVAASKFGFMEDLTSELAREWDDWCREPELFFAPRHRSQGLDTGRFRDLPLPVHVITASDDEICTEANIRNFWQHVHSQQQLSFNAYPAGDSPGGRIGHFGYFRQANRYIWDDVLRQLDDWQGR